ncbi:MAG: hypothetical protein AAF636_19510 [Pseudomonadota bacterium]
MANNRMLAIVTILLLSANSGQAQQEPSLDDLVTIDKLINEGDWQALYAFVEDNPQLTQGESALAVELNKFVNEVEQGPLNQFDAPADPAPASETVASIY